MATFNTIATAVKSVVDALSLGLTTVVRKDGSIYESDSLPLVVISFAGDLGEEWAATGNGSSDTGSVGRGVALEVGVYRETQGELQTGVDTNPDYFQSVKRSLNKGSLSGASTVWDTRLRTNELWEGRAFGQAGEVSSFQLEFGSAEQRN
jgi:hypothetical protein